MLQSCMGGQYVTRHGTGEGCQALFVYDQCCLTVQGSYKNVTKIMLILHFRVPGHTE